VAQIQAPQVSPVRDRRQQINFLIILDFDMMTTYPRDAALF